MRTLCTDGLTYAAAELACLRVFRQVALSTKRYLIHTLMHILSVDQRSHRKKRLSVEKAFQRINTFLFATQLATLLVGVGLLVAAGNKSMSNDFFSLSSTIDLSSLYFYPNCSHTFVTSNGLFNHYSFEVSSRNIEWMVSRAVYNIRRCIAMYALVIAVGGVNKLLFELNIHNWRFGHLVVRKDIFTVSEIFLLVLAFITTKALERENEMLNTYTSTCAKQAVAGTSTSSADTSVLFSHSVPLTSFYIGLSITAAVMFASMVVALYHMWEVHPKDAEKAAARVEESMIQGVLRRSVYGGQIAEDDGEEEEADGGYQLSDTDGAADVGGGDSAVALAPRQVPPTSMEPPRGTPRGTPRLGPNFQPTSSAFVQNGPGVSF